MAELFPEKVKEIPVWRRLANEWWESRDPRPRQPFIAAEKVIRAALTAGWSETDLRRALREIPVVSGGALDMWRAKHPVRRETIDVDVLGDVMGRMMGERR